MREIAFGQDGNFSWDAITERHNADLANGLGNLASRVLAMLASYFDGVVPESAVEGAESDMPVVVADAIARYDEHMLALQLQPALVAVWDIVDRANQYLVEKEPWKLGKDPTPPRDELAGVLYAAAETLRILAIAIGPIMPGAAERLWSQLGIDEPLEAQRVPAIGGLGRAPTGHRLRSRVSPSSPGRGRLTPRAGPIPARRGYPPLLQSWVRLARNMFHVKLPLSTGCGDPCKLAARERPEP